MKKVVLLPNKPDATLFVGLGGVGSRILRKLRDLAVLDNLDNVRFVTMDTDVNDLERLEKGAPMITVQTSSSRSVAAYLRHDLEAKHEWFPENKILDGKTVSEGAGQVRAISRLALNASIKQGKIAALYKAIDELYLKNGSAHNRAVKIVIASTATGGTGSGITLPVAMMIRKYLKDNYPESAAIIRGFLVMPSVMDTVITSESERKSQRRNGYATIKEINAFMMKASGAFDYDPRLQRYADLHMTIPTMTSESTRLSNLPFDFCFLLDRIDGNQRNMVSLKQYEEYAARSIYEQCIGPMRASVTSKEDNIHKEFSDPQKHGRCRFGGAGASVIRYPYEEIRDYIALDWAQNSIMGIPSSKGLTEEERERMIEKSWMTYDYSFEKKLKEWRGNPKASPIEPKLCDHYVEKVEGSKDDFTKRLQDKYLMPKVDELAAPPENKSDDGSEVRAGMDAVATSYFEAVCRAVKNDVGSSIIIDPDEKKTIKDCFENIGNGVKASKKKMHSAYKNVMELCKFMDHTVKLKRWVEAFVDDMFESQDIIGRDMADNRIGKYLSCGNRALHPNAARYLLYKLQMTLESESAKNKTFNREEFNTRIESMTNPDKKEALQVKGSMGKEQNLEDMCRACDAMPDLVENLNLNDRDVVAECAKKLNALYGEIKNFYNRYINAAVISAMQDKVSQLIATYEGFYQTFGLKAQGIEKRRESIVGELTNKPGKSVYNLFGDQKLLEALSRKAMPGRNDDGDNELYAKIFEIMCENMRTETVNKYDAYSTDVAVDIFEDVIIAGYKNLVMELCDPVIGKDILQAMKLEFETDCDIEIAKCGDDEEQKSVLKKRRGMTKEIEHYIQKLLVKGRNLASPGVSKNDFDEERSVDAIAYSTSLRDFAGIEINKFLEPKNADASVDPLELHFFRSIYGLTPVQLSKLCSPAMDKEDLAKCVDIRSVDTSAVEVGSYFLAYQEYMENIGPDCKLNALITPHIDKSWNSISVMPELDLDYQTHLMQDIHQAFFYGFLFDIIQRYQPSTRYDPKTVAYRYYDAENNPKAFTVSNGTVCDKFDEVLDSLYFDRAAVKTIKQLAHDSRDADRKSRVAFEDGEFAKALKNLSRTRMVGAIAGKEGKLAEEKPTSMFEIPIMYYNSLMVTEDIDEIRAMTEAIINAVEYQLSAKEKAADVKAHLAVLLVEQFNMLLENYNTFKDFLAVGVEVHSNNAMIAIYKCVKARVDKILQNGHDLYELDHFTKAK